MIVQFDERRVDAIFASIDQCRRPGAAVGIALRGRPVYRKGFGLASMELPILLAPTMRMRIYSTTKHFACFAYMRLCEEGRAGLDDRLGKHLPELHPVTREVTMRQLMTNTSGLRDSYAICWQLSGMDTPVSSTELLSLYRDLDDVNAAPGVAWSYNNGGFLLVSAVVERITGRTLEEALQTLIFEPIGMHDTLLRRFNTDFVPNSATMHMTNASGAFEKTYLATACSGEGGMVSTVDDLLRWLAHMDALVVGSAATWAAMKTPARLLNGTVTDYGLGLMLGRYRGIDIVHHPGGGLGANAQMLKVPAAGLDVVVLVNRQDVSGVDLTYKILDECLPGLEAAPESSAEAALTGVYRSPRTGRVVQLFVKDGKQIVSIDATDLPFERDGGRALKPTGLTGWLKQLVMLADESAQPASIRLIDFGNEDELVALPPPGRVDVQTIAGRYRSDTTRTDAQIFLADDNSPRLKTNGRFGSVTYELECLASGLWKARSMTAMRWSALLAFDADAPGFTFTSARTSALPFRRAPAA